MEDTKTVEPPPAGRRVEPLVGRRWDVVRSLTCGHLRAAHNYQTDPTVEWSDADIALVNAAPELAEALRELHDFAETSQHHRYRERSRLAFERAGEILKRVGF